MIKSRDCWGARQQHLNLGGRSSGQCNAALPVAAPRNSSEPLSTNRSNALVPSPRTWRVGKRICLSRCPGVSEEFSVFGVARRDSVDRSLARDVKYLR